MANLMLRAMSLCNFPRPLAILPLCPNHLARVGYPCLVDTPQDFLSYIKIIQIQPFLCYAPNGPGDYKAENENVHGYHVKNYRPSTSAYTKLITAFRDVVDLEYYGCRYHPTFRFCHGCDDLFADTFAPAFFPKLTKFTVNAAFISGGRLRAFLKKHANSLVYIDISSVNLTDSSWRSIAQGLAKLPHLEKLRLCDLRQKHKATAASRPKAYRNATGIFLDEVDAVKHFLGVFITYFGTVQYLNPKRFRKSPSMWHMAKLFSVSRPEGSYWGRPGADALKRYAEVEDMY
jgi:hypothetical protein